MKDYVVVSLFSLAILAIHVLINSGIELAPYMDEIFHIPQATLYCQGRFSEWDPKITTYPGLYLISAAFHTALNWTPSTASLRLCNVSFTVALLYALLLYRRKFLGRESDGASIPLLIVSSPLVLCYAFLYYTDILSLLLVVNIGLVSLDSASVIDRSTSKKLMTHDSLPNSFLRLLIVSVAILARQTNAVWAVFFAGADALTLLRLRGVYTDGIDNPLTLADAQKLAAALWKHLFPLCLSLWPYVLPVSAFALFSLRNGSIVLGDKENHSMVAHWAMPLHAIALTVAHTLPATLLHTLSAASKAIHSLLTIPFLAKSRADEKLAAIYDVCIQILTGPFSDLNSTRKAHSSPDRPRTRTMSRKEKPSPGQQLTTLCALLVGHLIGCALVTVCLVRYSFSHPFLLADNRHYTFYLWRRFLQYPMARALLGPPYYIAALLLISRLRSIRGPLWVVGFLIASCLVLVPTPLLEPRYFAPVITLALLHCQPTSTSTELVLLGIPISSRLMTQLSVIFAAALTSLLLYIFLYRPFTWPDGSIARFMP